MVDYSDMGFSFVIVSGCARTRTRTRRDVFEFVITIILTTNEDGVECRETYMRISFGSTDYQLPDLSPHYLDFVKLVCPQLWYIKRFPLQLNSLGLLHF